MVVDPVQEGYGMLQASLGYKTELYFSAPPQCLPSWQGGQSLILRIH